MSNIGKAQHKLGNESLRFYSNYVVAANMCQKQFVKF